METKVEKYLDANIKDIINEFNGVQQALDKFEIGCASCGLGTCKLRDVVGIHNLNAADEKKLITEIFGLIYPSETFDIPRLAPENNNAGNDVSLSPPLRMLVEEHVLIKRVLALAPVLEKVLDLTNPDHKQLLADVTDFIRTYADNYHHAKEEDILFQYFDSSLDIIKVMISDHIQGRAYVSEVLRAVDIADTTLAKTNLLNYANLLTEHIKKEDTILYPWMNSNLKDKQVGEMYSKFFEINNSRPDVQKKYEALVNRLEAEYR